MFTGTDAQKITPVPFSGPMTAGVGLFFQQDTPNTIFVASLTPGGAAARSGVIKKGDIVVQVNDEKVEGCSLADLRNLVLGPAGSVCVITFRRKTSPHAHFYFDVDMMRGTGEFLDVVERNHELTKEKEKLAAALADVQDWASKVEQDIQGILSHPVVKVEDPRVRELAQELQSRMDDLRRMEETKLRTEHRLREAEARKAEAQERLEREAAARLQAHSAERDRAFHVEDLDRKHKDEQMLWEEVREKLRSDARLEEAAKAQSDEALSQAMRELHELKQELLGLRIQGQGVNRALTAGNEALQRALRLNESCATDLAALVPEQDRLHDWFLAALRASVKQSAADLPPLPQPQISLPGAAGFPAMPPAPHLAYPFQPPRPPTAGASSSGPLPASSLRAPSGAFEALRGHPGQRSTSVASSATAAHHGLLSPAGLGSLEAAHAPDHLAPAASMFSRAVGNAGFADSAQGLGVGVGSDRGSPAQGRLSDATSATQPLPGGGSQRDSFEPHGGGGGADGGGELDVAALARKHGLALPRVPDGGLQRRAPSPRELRGEGVPEGRVGARTAVPARVPSAMTPSLAASGSNYGMPPMTPAGPPPLRHATPGHVTPLGQPEFGEEEAMA